METATMMRFRLEPCERCRRETIHALRDPSASLPSAALRAGRAGDARICSGCEPAAFERIAHEAGRNEFLR